MITWQYYPRSATIPPHLEKCVTVFKQHDSDICSPDNTLKSDEVLSVLLDDLIALEFKVESSKRKKDKIHVPVLYGRNGKPEKTFEADAYHEENKTVLEVEAGRGVANYQFLKDLFQACMMHDVDYLVIAIRNIYKTSNSSSRDFEIVTTFFDTLYASGRLNLPLKGILIIGY